MLLRLSVFLLCAVPAVATDPPIRFPVIPSAPVVAPDTPAKLSADSLYVIDSDVELVVLSSPRGVLRATAEPGPMRIKGKFADGNGTYETRLFGGKHIYTVEVVPNAGGVCELIVIPVGLKAESEVIRRLIDAGHAPMPPPKPEPEPGPKPDPDPVKVQEVAVVVIEETAGRTPEIARVLGDTKYWQGLTARGHIWRFYDKDSPDAAKYAAVVSDVPGILVMAKDGKKLYAGKLPATVADLDAILKKAGAK